jgi:S1-C subfamily serine protease
MRMKFLSLVTLFLISSILSSCASQTTILTNIRTARKAFVKVETWVGICDVASQACLTPEIFSVGSGSVVLYGGNKVILTAAHVCQLGDYEKKIQKQGGRVFLKVVDREGKSRNASIIKSNSAVDVCLLRAKDLDLPYIPISRKRPEYGERVYNIASPMGISDGEMVPLFTGHFFGNHNGNAYYSIPTVGGASGSPILNSKGELVGMIHSVHYRFHHISLSARYVDLWNFLGDARSHTTILRNLCLHSDCGQSHIEEFLLEYDTFE